MEVVSALNVFIESLEERKNSKFLSTAVQNEMKKIAADEAVCVAKELACEPTDEFSGLCLTFSCKNEFQSIIFSFYPNLQMPL